MAQGNKMAARNTPLPRWRSIATGRPMSSSVPTATTVKYAVVPSADQKRPSVTRNRKLAIPMKLCSWKMRIDRCRLSQSAARTGNTATPTRIAMRELRAALPLSSPSFRLQMIDDALGAGKRLGGRAQPGHRSGQLALDRVARELVVRRHGPRPRRESHGEERGDERRAFAHPRVVVHGAAGWN